ncbi:MAG: hypothetical protein AAGA71_06050 [Pseudomonadota bacterium]
MTSTRQIAANRTNALASTGPRTRSGKTRSGRNATKHGLNARPTEDAIDELYRAVVGDAFAELPPTAHGRRHAAARALAAAEAKLDRVKAVEATFMSDVVAEADLTDHLTEARKTIVEKRAFVPGVSLEVEAQLLRRARKEAYARTETERVTHESVSQRLRLLHRYRRAAEVARHKALRAYLATDTD